MSVISFLLNLAWILFGGFWMAVGWAIADELGLLRQLGAVVQGSS